MNNVLFKYHYSGLFRHKKGLGFLITAPVSVEEKANGIVRHNDIENPELLVGSFVRLDTFNGYNGRETFHKKMFPFANFKIVDIVNYGNGTYAVIVDYPAIAPGVEQTEPTSVQYENELFVPFDTEFLSVYDTEIPAEVAESNNNIAGSGCFRVSASKFQVTAENVSSGLISVPDGDTASGTGSTSASPKKAISAGGYSLKQLALIVLIIVVLIAIFKYLV